jgi:hypothetical protein
MTSGKKAKKYLYDDYVFFFIYNFIFSLSFSVSSVPLWCYLLLIYAIIARRYSLKSLDGDQFLLSRYLLMNFGWLISRGFPSNILLRNVPVVPFGTEVTLGSVCPCEGFRCKK